VTQLTELYQLKQFNDSFALGHYARVFDAFDHTHRRKVAFKILRLEHLEHNGDIRWEYRAFPHEAVLLQRLASVPQIVKLYDCGYTHASEEVPQADAVVTFGDDIRAFDEAQHTYAAQGWRPFLVLEHMPRMQNLLYLMKPNRPGARWRLPTEEGLAIAMQFAQVLKHAHQNQIVYMDHKLEHVYWDGSHLHIIDLNSSRMIDTQGDDPQLFRKDIHNLCVGILYPIFTGMSPMKTALKPQPSGLSEVDARYQEISMLDFGVEPSLSQDLQKLLQRGAAMQIETVDDFIEELTQVCHLHGWDFSGNPATSHDRQARDHLREGLRTLREGQESIRQARDLFREAAVLDGITPDLEDELHRLLKAVNEMLNQRVIP
jgi:serine/threonine protein kinase